MRFNKFGGMVQGHSKYSIGQMSMDKYKIPLPPLEVQREIVAEIEGYQRVIDGARAVIDNYRPQIVVDPEWPMVALEEACEIKRGKFSHSLRRSEPRIIRWLSHPFIQTGDVSPCQWRNDLIHTNSKR